MKKLLITLSVLVFLLPVGCISSTQPEGFKIEYPEDVHELEPYGLSESEIEFYDSFQGKLLTIPRKKFKKWKPAKQRKAIKRDLSKQYRKRRSDIKDFMPGLTKKERFLAFVMLKVNGSKPIYYTNGYPSNEKELFYSDYGQCQIYTTTVLSILRIYGMEGNALGFETPAIFGHVVAEYYDKNTNTAYIIDANSNAFIKYENATGVITDMLPNVSVEEADEAITIYQFPYYERYFKFDERFWDDRSDEDRVDMVGKRNNFYASRLADGWKSSLTTHKDTIPESFDREFGSPGGIFTLEEIAAEYGFDNIDKFWE